MTKKTKARRRFTADFKTETAKLVLDQGMTRAQVAKDLGLSPAQVGKWVIELTSQGDCAYPGKGRLPPQEQKIKDLEKEVKKLRMERDILKKATVFFANHGG